MPDVFAWTNVIPLPTAKTAKLFQLVTLGTLPKKIRSPR